MLASVEVMSAAEFDAWLEQRRAEQDAGSGELGKEEWAGVCAKCHGMNGEGGIGPRHRRLADAEPTRRRSRTIVRNGRAHDAGGRLGLDGRADRGARRRT